VIGVALTIRSSASCPGIHAFGRGEIQAFAEHVLSQMRTRAFNMATLGAVAGNGSRDKKRSTAPSVW